MNAESMRSILERDKRRINKTVDNSALANGLTAVVKQYFSTIDGVECEITSNRDGSVSIVYKTTAEGIRTK